MVDDIYSPPVASRTYAYVTIAGYEAAIFDHPDYISLAGQLLGLKALPKPIAGKVYCYPLASVQAILTVGKSLVSSEDKIKKFRDSIMQDFRNSGMPEEVFQNSVTFGKLVADHILAWSSTDNYKKIKSLSKFSGTDDEASWKPTPPSYMSAVEPHWSMLRTFVLDSAQQFKPLPAMLFSTNDKSEFYIEAKKVFDAGINLTPLQIEIAQFWDCNPFKMNLNGHVRYATKKISPGGHWININRLACKKVNADFVKCAQTYAWLSIIHADAFISCWDEKYRSNVIRPETYINQYVDELWLPLLQTPPFPEYTSGHSVISSASSIVLTDFFGENFQFSDSTELEFGLPVRHFKSFKQAADEASISRFYGGIHYMPAIINGIEEGELIGKFIVKTLKTNR